MTEYEAYDLALNLIEFGHNLGEATLVQIQFWIGVSYALLAITLIAPEKLTIGTTALLLLLYITFTAHTFHNIGFDVDTSTAARVDARKVLEDRGLSLDIVAQKLRMDTDSELSSTRNATALFIPGLFLGTIGYVVFICRREFIARKKRSNS
jgi:hypothetical protein